MFSSLKRIRESKRRIYFANDCRDYHGGSWAVSEVIRKEIRDAGWCLITEEKKDRVEEKRIEKCQAVLVNGEGTLHHDKRRSRHLMDILRFSQKAGLQSALINTSWSHMGSDHGDVLRKLDQLVAREPFSLARLEKDAGRVPDFYPDLSWQHAISKTTNRKRNGVLATDFFSEEFDAFVAIRGGSMSKLDQLDMRNISWSETIRSVSGASVFITGRFHGLMAALVTRTPFVAYPGNTDKTNGVLAWLGAESCIATTSRDLLTLAQSWKDRQGVYDEAFDRIASSPKWKLTL